jgi:hypothetical protein
MSCERERTGDLSAVGGGVKNGFSPAATRLSANCSLGDARSSLVDPEMNGPLWIKPRKGFSV